MKHFNSKIIKGLSVLAVMLVLCLSVNAQNQSSLKKVYDEEIDPMEQIDQALVKAQQEGKYVICQLGGNWCPWCLKFADYISKDEDIKKIIEENFIYIHVNYNPRKAKSEENAEKAKQLLKRLGNAGRFGYPVFVILDPQVSQCHQTSQDAKEKIVHIQDSSYLEEGEGYSKKKVMSFFKHWTPAAVSGK